MKTYANCLILLKAATVLKLKSYRFKEVRTANAVTKKFLRAANSHMKAA
jgi:hypothetical protein